MTGSAGETVTTPLYKIRGQLIFSPRCLPVLKFRDQESAKVLRLVFDTVLQEAIISRPFLRWLLHRSCSDHRTLSTWRQLTGQHSSNRTFMRTLATYGFESKSHVMPSGKWNYTGALLQDEIYLHKALSFSFQILYMVAE